jgi:hypothetical protein
VKINMVIVDSDIARGQRAGRQMAKELRENFRDWEMHVHVRLSTTLTTDDAYAKYVG